MSIQQIFAVQIIADLKNTSLSVSNGDLVEVAGYHAANDGGGGLFAFNSGSTATSDDGLIVPRGADDSTPGRFFRVYDDQIHTKWFGIKHDGTSGQALQLQKAINAAISNHATLVIDDASNAGTGINCDGAVLYFNNGGTAAAVRVEGVNKRYSIIRNAILVVGTPGATGGDGLASGRHYFGNFMLVGSLHLWSVENTSVFDGLFITPRKATDLPDGLGYGIIAYACNHPLFLGCVVEPVTAEGESRQTASGVLACGTNNMTWISGGVSRCLDGMVIGEVFPAPSYAGDWTPPTTLNLIFCPSPTIIGLHSEVCYANSLRISQADGASIIGGHMRSQSTTLFDKDWSKAIIQIGAAGLTTPTATTISGTYVVTGPGYQADAIGIEVVKAAGGRIDNTVLTSLGTGIKADSANAAIDIGSNSFKGTTGTRLSAGSNTKISLPTPEVEQVATLVDASPIVWNASFRHAKVTLATTTARSLSQPTNLTAGTEYTLAIRKSDAGANLNVWPVAFKWLGSAPDIASMATNQEMLIRLYCEGVTGGVIVLAEARGPFTVA